MRFPVSPKSLSGRVPSTANRVICPLSFLDEKIKKQANCRQSLLKRRIRQANRWNEVRSTLVSMRARTLTKVADIASEICPCSGDWRNVRFLAEPQKVIKATGIGVKCVGGQAEQRFGGQPRFCKVMSCNEWITEPLIGSVSEDI